MSDLIVPIPPLQRCLICLSPCIVLKGPLFKGQRSFARSAGRSSYRRLIRISDRSIAIAMSLPSPLPPSAASAVQLAQDGQHQSVGQTFSVLLSFRRHKAPLLAPLPAPPLGRSFSLSPAQPSSSGHRVLWLWLGFDRGVTTGGREGGRRKGEREREERGGRGKRERGERDTHSLTANSQGGAAFILKRPKRFGIRSSSAR